MNRRFSRLGILALAGIGAVALPLAAQGCSDSDPAVEDAGTYEGGRDANDPACSSCVQQGCSVSWAACLTDPTCHAMHVCASGANDPSNHLACVCSAADNPAANVDSENAYRAFAQCNALQDCKCGSECKTSCDAGSASSNLGACAVVDAGQDTGAPDAGDDADAGDVDSGDLDAGDAGDADATAPPPRPAPNAGGCVSCSQQRCLDQNRSCGRGTVCETYLRCLYDCRDATCTKACTDAYPQALVVVDDLIRCGRFTCTQCGF